MIKVEAYSSPHSNDRHAGTSEEEGNESVHLQASAAPHALAEEIYRNQIYESHVHKDTGRDRIEDSYHDQCIRAIFVVGRADAHSDRDTQRCRDREAQTHEECGHCLELRHRNASSQSQAFEELMERQSNEKWFDSAGTA